VQRLVVVDDGWGWWPCLSAIEVGVAAAVGDITVVSPSSTFAAAIPAESRVQFLARLGETRLQVLALQRLAAADAGGVELRGVSGGASHPPGRGRRGPRRGAPRALVGVDR
jgi:2,4-dienoyl-CoA reductase (NADPH2)